MRRALLGWAWLSNRAPSRKMATAPTVKLQVVNAAAATEAGPLRRAW